MRSFALRLVRKRPLTVWLPDDRYKLRNGEAGRGAFETIGAADERAPLRLEELISYDEMPIAALLCVSTRTPFYNDVLFHAQT